jgi:hypothetical protein
MWQLFRKGDWFQTFTHELTHTVVAILFFRKIHGFHADEKGGVMYHSGGRFGDIFISLAPYCFPIFTYIFLFLRIFSAENHILWFDVFVGFTLAFHISCFTKQTGNHQTDIQRNGYFKSYLFIAVFGLFNASIILLCIPKGIVKSFIYLFSQYWKDVLTAWNHVGTCWGII